MIDIFATDCAAGTFDDLIEQTALELLVVGARGCDAPAAMQHMRRPMSAALAKDLGQGLPEGEKAFDVLVEAVARRCEALRGMRLPWKHKFARHWIDELRDSMDVEDPHQAARYLGHGLQAIERVTQLQGWSRAAARWWADRCAYLAGVDDELVTRAREGGVVWGNA